MNLDATKTIIIGIILIQCGCLTTAPVFKITDKYIETGKILNHLGTAILDTTSYYGNISKTSINQADFAFTYINTHTSYVSAVSFQSLELDITASWLLNLTITICQETTTDAHICLISSNLNMLH
jgi:hypothetical protein